MACYAVEIVCSNKRKDNPNTTPSPVNTPLPTVLPDRVNQNILGHIETVATASQHGITSIPSRAGPGGETVPSHSRGLYRFKGSQNKTQILESITTSVVADSKWYEVRYHDCDHDEPEQQGCGDWVVHDSSGSVPSGV